MNNWENSRQFLYNAFARRAKYGLFNQGATCYLNSVLQVLFMTEDFREAVERHASETPGTIDHHLKQLFDDLKRGTTYTFKITKTLGIDRVDVERDAAEYFEKILSLTGPEASQIFHGQLTHKNICSQCGSEKDNDEAFWHLPLALVDSFGKEDYSVVNGVKEYFRPFVFSGENQMYCDECDAKSDATNKCVIKHHPEVLMLLLKRFEFDYSYMGYVKIYCTVDIPYTLQIPENQMYELYAVVDHVGDLRSGCYTATIKADESWYHFNDAVVTLLDYQPFQVDNFEKSSTAYLLFYRKPKVRAADTCTQDIWEVSTPGGFLPATSDIYEQREDAGKIRERDEVEGAAEAGNDKQSDEGKIVMDDEEDMRGNAEAGKRETQLEERFKDQDNDSGRLDDVRRRRPDINHVYKDGKTGDNEQSEKKRKSLTKYLNNNVEHPDNEQNISGGLGGTQEVGQDDQRCEQISRSTNKKHEQQRKEKRDVKRVKEQKRGDDNCQDVEDQNNEGSDDIRQNQSEQKNTDTHSRHKDVCVVKQAKEQEDGHIQNRADSPVRRAGSTGSRRLTENQGVSRVEKTRHGDSRPRARTGFNQDTNEGRRGSEQLRLYHVKIIEEEFEGGIQMSSETKYLSMQTVGGSSRGINIWVENNDFCHLKQSVSPSPEPQKHWTTGVTENESNSSVPPNARKMLKVSAAQGQAVGKQLALKKRRHTKRKWWHFSSPLKQHRAERTKQKKTTGYFNSSCKRQKNADQSRIKTKYILCPE